MQNTLLNLTPGAYSPEVHLSQYDKGRTIPFKLMDGNAEYTVPSGAVIKVKATKPSGLGFVVDCTYDGGTVTITNTETMSNEAGRFPAELSISVGDVLLGTANFIFNVERSPHPKGTTDGDAETLLPELTLLVKEIRESNAKVESMTASATALSSDANPTANYNSETNNLAFGIPTPDVTKSELLNLYITKSASGSIASFSDGADDVPLKSLEVQIVPKQSGSGDPSPSNIRPISGWDSVNVNVGGANVWDEEWELGVFNTTTGANTYSASNIRSKNYIPVVPNATYYFNVPSYVWTIFFDADKNVIANPIGGYPDYQADGNSRGIGDNYKHAVTMPSNCHYIRFYCQTVYGSTYKNDISINLPSTVMGYKPYIEPTTYPISLGQTVYGGVLDVVSGKLSINKAYVDLGSLNWNSGSDSRHTVFFARFDGLKYVGNNVVVDAISSQYRAITKSAWSGADIDTDYVFRSDNSEPTLYFRNLAYTDASAFKTAMNGVQLVYELATPIEVTLTPTQVTTLLGNNNIFADSGDSEVEYRADSTLAYEELSNAIISLGGNI